MMGWRKFKILEEICAHKKTTLKQKEKATNIILLCWKNWKNIDVSISATIKSMYYIIIITVSLRTLCIYMKKPLISFLSFSQYIDDD